MKSLQRKEDFTEVQVDDLQCLADDFFSNWLDLTGYDGITNYMHMIGAGHLRYYLKKWKNLNRFSNQGWESYNAMLASFWHHRTMKGGGKNVAQQSKIQPIAHWILRVMLWRTGTAQQFFNDWEKNNSFSDDDESNDDDSSSLD